MAASLCRPAVANSNLGAPKIDQALPKRRARAFMAMGGALVRALQSAAAPEQKQPPSASTRAAPAQRVRRDCNFSAPVCVNDGRRDGVGGEGP